MYQYIYHQVHDFFTSVAEKIICLTEEQEEFDVNDKCNQVTEVYAGRLKDNKKLLSSSSGGAFTALSDFILKQDGAVVCAVYNYDSHRVEFRLITDITERDKAKGSKYLQSTMGEIFRQSELWIKENPTKKILFIGTGCQAEGFRKYAELKKIRDRCLIVDIICHGAPSPQLWQEYASALEKKYNGKIEYLTFKDKRKGWLCPTAFVRIDQKEILITEYVRFFFSEVPLRPSCYQCPFAKIERNIDMTIGDFWHIEEKIPEFYDPNGTSLFLLHTEQGIELFESIKHELHYLQSTREECWQNNLESPTSLPNNREEVLEECRRNGTYATIMKYHKIKKFGILKRILHRIKKTIRG